MTDNMIIQSNGGGIQSTALFYQALSGLIKIDFSIFIDTGAEKKSTYEAVDRMRTDGLGKIPLIIWNKKNLEGEIINRKKVSIPVFLSDGGQLGRNCTSDIKINGFKQAVKYVLGLGKYAPFSDAEIVLGISQDEVSRINKPHIKQWINSYPLIGVKVDSKGKVRKYESDVISDRYGCVRWLKNNNIEVPEKSSCIFCPYQKKRDYLKLSSTEFNRVVKIERVISEKLKKSAFLNQDRRPITDIDLHSGLKNQMEIPFECSGTCHT